MTSNASSPANRREPPGEPSATIAAALAGIAGFADAIAYLRWHQFGANMTGNTVLFGIAATHRDPRAIAVAFAPIAAFVVGCALAQFASARSPAYALGTAAACALGASFAGAHRVQVDLIAAAMGLTNTAVSTFGGVKANTSFVTGDYGRIAQAAVRLAFRRDDDRTRGDDRETLIVVVPLVVTYAVGAACAATLVGLGVAHALLIVVPVLAAIAYGVRTKRGRA